MKFAVPGKTFLVGEYAVLLGGPALGLATSPCFEIEYSAQHHTQLHPQSPAAQYLGGKELKAKISNPYKGGFGRSTAEYWAAVIPDLINTPVSFDSLLAQYKKLHAGSGVDLAIQYFGEVTEASAGVFKSTEWGLPALDFFILSTGLKVPTHEHLRELDLKSLAELPEQAAEVIKSFTSVDKGAFLYNLRAWVETLEKHNLTHAHSLEMRVHLESFSGVSLAKPCGALGADVMMVFFNPEERASVLNFLNQNHYQIRAGSADLHAGLAAQLKQHTGGAHVG